MNFHRSSHVYEAQDHWLFISNAPEDVDRLLTSFFSTAPQALQQGADGRQDERHSRARLPPEKLTSEQQVACLFNQATDPNILGRLWVGCEPLMQGCGGFEAVGGL